MPRDRADDDLAVLVITLPHDLAALETPEARQEAMKGTVEDWGRPNRLLAAREAYQDVASGVRIKPGAKTG